MPIEIGCREQPGARPTGRQQGTRERFHGTPPRKGTEGKPERTIVPTRPRGASRVLNPRKSVPEPQVVPEPISVDSRPGRCSAVGSESAQIGSRTAGGSRADFRGFTTGGGRWADSGDGDAAGDDSG